MKSSKSLLCLAASANRMEDATFTESMREQKTLDTMTEFEKALRKDGYRAGWNDRADHDRELIEDAARQSRDFEDFIANLREKFRKNGRVDSVMNKFEKEYITGRKDQFDIDYAIFRKAVEETETREQRI